MFLGNLNQASIEMKLYFLGLEENNLLRCQLGSLLGKLWKWSAPTQDSVPGHLSATSR